MRILFGRVFVAYWYAKGYHPEHLIRSFLRYGNLEAAVEYTLKMVRQVSSLLAEYRDNVLTPPLFSQRQLWTTRHRSTRQAPGFRTA